MIVKISVLNSGIMQLHYQDLVFRNYAIVLPRSCFEELCSCTTQILFLGIMPLYYLDLVFTRAFLTYYQTDVLLYSHTLGACFYTGIDAMDKIQTRKRFRYLLGQNTTCDCVFVYVFGSCFRTLAVILVSEFCYISNN